MTIAMPDSITPANLPAGYPAYLCYVDGEWPTEVAVGDAHPQARLLSLTVLGGGADADGCDRETGDLTPAGAAAWLHLRLQAGQRRPVLYASVASVMQVLTVLAGLGVARSQIRILTAHYGQGEHICSPASCGQLAVYADGTQWTDEYPGVGGAAIDMSVLADDFFGTPAPAPAVDWTETIMQQLPELRQGSAGTFVRTAQFQCGERGHPVKVDGAFGNLTGQAVIAVQRAAGVTADGVVGPVTWSVLITGSAQ